MGEVTQLITSVGFPIAACIGMAWYVKYQTDQNKSEIKEIRETYAMKVEKATEALNNNTIAINKLAERLDKEMRND